MVLTTSKAILVAGASGFVGRALVQAMAARGMAGTAVSRRVSSSATGSIRSFTVGDYSDREAMAKAARNCAAAVILAGRAHVLSDTKPGATAAFHLANSDVPVAIAEACDAAGVRRIVFVSSIAVNGSATRGQPFREDDQPAPTNDYGRSKLAGERNLERRCREIGLELAIIRPPLVYGPGAPGNFGQLLQAARRGVPLPLAGIRNRRDLIGVVNLADLILLAARHPSAAGGTFLAADGEEISTAELARVLYRAAGHERRLFSVPAAFLRLAARAAGRPQMATRLLDDLVVDSGLARRRLGWNPPLPLADGLRHCLNRLAAWPES